MKKNFVLDTNVLVHDPNSIYQFEENDVYIPLQVVEELDGLKSQPGEPGFCAREAVRILGELRELGSLEEGVLIASGGKIHFQMEEDLDVSILPIGWKKDKMDNLILLSAIKLAEKEPNVILVTNDADMILKADILGVAVQEYQNDRLDPNAEAYSGRSEHKLDAKFVDMFAKTKSLHRSAFEKDGVRLTANEFVTFGTWDNNATFLGKLAGDEVVALRYAGCRPCDLAPRNSGQTFLMESLLSPAIEQPLTLCMGPAGTGKTLFAIGCGLDEVMEHKRYKGVLVCRANVTMDEEIGFLPGSEQDKIDPLMRGVYDNLEVMFRTKEDTREDINGKIIELFMRGYITMQSVGYLRGRSINDTYIIIDEAQNCTPNQILSIITRAGQGSKIVLLGDPNQIDNHRLDRRNNGLTFAVERMKGSRLCGVVSFTESECIRSELAKEASSRLKRSS